MIWLVKLLHLLVVRPNLRRGRSPAAADEALANRPFGLWGKRERDGVSYQDAVRRDWVERARE